MVKFICLVNWHDRVGGRRRRKKNNPIIFAYISLTIQVEQSAKPFINIGIY